MADNKQTTDPLKETTPNVAPRGGVGLPLPPLQRDPGKGDGKK